MKTLLRFALSLCMVGTSISALAQIRVLSNGNVGINYANPQHRLEIQGSTRWVNWTHAIMDWTESHGSPVLYPSFDWYLHLGKNEKRVGTLWVYTIHYRDGIYKDSDFRLKENIKPISDARQKLVRLNVVSYNYKAGAMGAIPERVMQKVTSNQVGLIAQEVEKLYPYLVDTDDSTGLKGVDYVGFVPLIIQALKEQDSVISAQAAQIRNLQKMIKDRMDTKNALVANSLEELETAYLEQNTPNPFRQQTAIGYFLPKSTNQASIYIYNLSGLLLKTIAITAFGKGVVEVGGSELSPGMYLYSLVADNREVDTKRMILTE